MNGLRKILGLFMAVALTAFAVPALADGGDQFRIVMAPATVSSGAQTITATITNRARFDFLKSFKITVPGTLTSVAILSSSSNIPSSKIKFQGGVISVSGVAIPYNQTATLTLTATYPGAACGTTDYTWNTTAQGGLIVSNEVFTLDAPNSNLKTSATWLGNTSLAFVSPPTSVLKDAAFNIVVKEVSSCPGVTLPEIPITLTSSPVFTAGGGTQTTIGNQATFTGNTLGQVGPATLTASTTASGYANAMTGLTVLTNGNLACGDPSNPTPANTINGSPSTDFTINDPGYAEGARGFNVVKAGRPNCADVNWTFTNNVLGMPNDPPVIDPHGNTIPPNGVSFVWDQGAQPNAAYSIYGDVAGRVVRHRFAEQSANEILHGCDVQQSGRGPGLPGAGA